VVRQSPNTLAVVAPRARIPPLPAAPGLLNWMYCWPPCIMPVTTWGSCNRSARKAVYSASLPGQRTPNNLVCDQDPHVGVCHVPAFGSKDGPVGALRRDRHQDLILADGFDRRDLKQTKALLDDLTGCLCSGGPTLMVRFREAR
jgi:hypothetical protein